MQCGCAITASAPKRRTCFGIATPVRRLRAIETCVNSELRLKSLTSNPAPGGRGEEEPLDPVYVKQGEGRAPHHSYPHDLAKTQFRLIAPNKMRQSSYVFALPLHGGGRGRGGGGDVRVFHRLSPPSHPSP